MARRALVIGATGLLGSDTTNKLCRAGWQVRAVGIEKAEDEYYVTIDHPMEKDHYVSFFAATSDNGAEFVKLYPEQNAEARFKISRTKAIYAYCNRHGLFRTVIGTPRR